MGFWRWGAEEEARKESVLRPYLSKCRGLGVDSQRPGTNFRPTHKLVLVGCTGTSGMWTRCWIIPHTNVSGVLEPTCMPGDHLDVRMESGDAKVGIDRTLDLNNGVYEMIFYIRKKGIYRVVVDKLQTHDALLGNPLRIADASKDPKGLIGIFQKENHFTLPPPQLRKTPPYPLNTESFPDNDYTDPRGVDTVPVPVRCDETDDWDRFRFGAWYRVGSCDGIHCGGKLKESMEGWAWVSDVCIMQMYTHEQLRRVFNHTWIMGWGGSTLKQPFSNAIEYDLGHPIFGTFMWELDKLKASKKKPNFFSYRQYDTYPLENCRFSMVWGGCMALNQGPSHCSTTQGIGTWPKLPMYLGSAKRTSMPGIPTLPQMIVMDHSVWRYPNHDVTYYRRVDDLFAKFDDLFKGERVKPLLVWTSGSVGGNANQIPRADGPICELLRQHHTHWTHEDWMTKHKHIVYIAKNTITLPLHFDNEFVHFGIHYGSSPGMCNTGHSRKGYEFKLCVRKTWADDAVVAAWWNALVYHLRHSLRREIPL
jgi:hypothetical protein